MLKLIAEAHTNQQIAELLFISPKTVENHCARLREKLGMRDRFELTRSSSTAHEPRIARTDRGSQCRPPSCSGRRGVTDARSSWRCLRGDGLRCST